MTDHALPQSASVPLPLRFFDVVLVLAFVPFALLAGLPTLGALGGAGVWIAQRAIGVAIDVKADASADYKRALGMTFAGGIARPLLTGLTILAIGQAGEREDGLTAALVCLVAFSVYLVLSVIFRPTRGTQSP